MEEDDGPHPLMEKIVAIASEETDADKTMWLMDSMEEYIRATRYKICMDDVVYKAIQDQYFLVGKDSAKERKRLMEGVESLLERIKVEERELHYDKLGPGGRKELAGLTTSLIILPEQREKKSKKKGKSSRSQPESDGSVVRMTWTAFFDPGTEENETDWLEVSSSL